MTAILRDMMHQEIEAYVDNVIIKSRKQDDHVRDFRKFFERLRKYDLKLNPSKYAFGVLSGKLLGFILLKIDAAIKWADECQEAFDKIKEYLSNPPVLVPPEPVRPLFLYLTVLENSFSCILGQHDVTGKKEQAVYYLINVTRTTIKVQALADHLAESPVDNEYQPLNTYFPDEEVNSAEVISEDTNAWKMFFDGAVNAKSVGIRAILISPIGQHYPAPARLQFFSTNNTVDQGEWETRDIKLIPYMQHVEDLSKRFKSVEFRYIPHFHNELTYAVATLASMLPYPGNLHIDPLEIQIQERHGYCNTVEAKSDVRPWYHDIMRFLETKEYPDQANGDQKRTIRRFASDFFLSGEVLYKRTPDLNLLRYVDAEEARRI
uniref:Uncharacterized protein LOC104213931 n=1 Tax=Nicotiana sylvestris TaxID=4096 RepID=A0A1U7V0L4_NICSY